MQQLYIVTFISATSASPNTMVDVPGPLLHLQRLPAYPTSSLLILPLVLDPTVSGQSLLQFPYHSCFQIQFPLWIVGIDFAPYLHLADDPHFACFHQHDWPGFPPAIASCPREYPILVPYSWEVFLLDPLEALLPMSFPTPAPRHLKDSVIHFLKDAFTHGMTMIHGPSLDLLIQTIDHVSCRHALRVLHRFPDLGQERLDASSRWFDQYLAISIASHRLTKEIEASSICVILVFSWESSRPRSFKNCSTRGLTSYSRRIRDVPVMMKSSA